jgi:hypothetical protein
MNKLRMKLAAAAIVVAAIAGGSAASPANAYWYNTTTVQGSYSIQVRNTDNHYFYVKPGNSASDVNLAVAGWGEGIQIKNMQTFAVWRYCKPKGGAVTVPAQPFGVIEIRKYKC